MGPSEGSRCHGGEAGQAGRGPWNVLGRDLQAGWVWAWPGPTQKWQEERSKLRTGWARDQATDIVGLLQGGSEFCPQVSGSPGAQAWSCCDLVSM